MSAPESSRPQGAPPALSVLVLGLVLGPVVALANQQAIYSSDSWACGHGLRGTLHIIPALCMLVVAGMMYESHRTWVVVGRGLADEDDSAATRARFLAILGMTISAFSGLVIVAQWLGIFMFDPCVKL